MHLIIHGDNYKTQVSHAYHIQLHHMLLNCHNHNLQIILQNLKKIEPVYGMWKELENN